MVEPYQSKGERFTMNSETLNFDFENIKIQNRIMKSAVFPYLASPNFGFPIRTFDSRINDQAVKVEFNNLETLTQALDSEEKAIIFGSTDKESSIVLEKRRCNWFFYPGSVHWFASDPVCADTLRMVRELNAIKLLSASFNENKEILKIYEMATRYCIDGDLDMLSDSMFLAEQIKVLETTLT